MKIELRWVASLSSSCFHAAEALTSGKSLVDDQMSAAITEPANNLAHEISAAGLPVQLWWQNLIPLAAGIDNNRQLVELVLRKMGSQDAQAEILLSRLPPLLTALEQTLQAATPNALDELALRSKPLRQQWEAYGPGLLSNIARQTDQRLIVTNADVILVHPALGGASVSHLPYNSVRIEAVLANPIAELPETVRLGWALSQLNIDLPMYSETIHASRLPLVAKLAMTPFTLQAAEMLDLARCDKKMIKTAITEWRVEGLCGMDLSEVVQQWWKIYRESRPEFHVALSALDRMLDKGEP